jgi:hypothetical protein
VLRPYLYGSMAASQLSPDGFQVPRYHQKAQAQRNPQQQAAGSPSRQGGAPGTSARWHGPHANPMQAGPSGQQRFRVVLPDTLAHLCRMVWGEERHTLHFSFMADAGCGPDWATIPMSVVSAAAVAAVKALVPRALGTPPGFTLDSITAEGTRKLVSNMQRQPIIAVYSLAVAVPTADVQSSLFNHILLHEAATVLLPLPGRKTPVPAMLQGKATGGLQRGRQDFYLASVRSTQPMTPSLLVQALEAVPGLVTIMAAKADSPADGTAGIVLGDVQFASQAVGQETNPLPTSFHLPWVTTPISGLVALLQGGQRLLSRPGQERGVELVAGEMTACLTIRRLPNRVPACPPPARDPANPWNRAPSAPQRPPADPQAAARADEGDQPGAEGPAAEPPVPQIAAPAEDTIAAGAPAAPCTNAVAAERAAPPTAVQGQATAVEAPADHGQTVQPDPPAGEPAPAAPAEPAATAATPRGAPVASPGAPATNPGRPPAPQGGAHEAPPTVAPAPVVDPATQAGTSAAQPRGPVPAGSGDAMQVDDPETLPLPPAPATRSRSQSGLPPRDGTSRRSSSSGGPPLRGAVAKSGKGSATPVVAADLRVGATQQKAAKGRQARRSDPDGGHP